MPVPYPQPSYFAPKTSYKKIAVVLMHFEDDGIGCVDLEQELADIFRMLYGITDITHVLLDNDYPYETMEMIVEDLKKKRCTTEDSLIILVFTGYGALQTLTDSSGPPVHRSVVGGAYNNDGSFRTRTLDWRCATDSLRTMRCDTLHIMNCSYVPPITIGWFGDAEILAATSTTSGASACQCRSFMKALIHEFRRLSSRPFTISTFYTELIKNQSALGLHLTPLYSKRFNRDSILFNNSGRAPAFNSVANTQHQAGRSRMTRKFYPRAPVKKPSQD